MLLFPSFNFEVDLGKGRKSIAKVCTRSMTQVGRPTRDSLISALISFARVLEMLRRTIARSIVNADTSTTWSVGGVSVPNCKGEGLDEGVGDLEKNEANGLWSLEVF